MYGRVDRRKGTVCANVAAYGETEDVHHRTRLVFFTPVNSRVPLSLTAGFCFDLLKFRYGRGVYAALRETGTILLLRDGPENRPNGATGQMSSGLFFKTIGPWLLFGAHNIKPAV
ncbi:hypothetical protein Peur_048291 [Populus x canadensis]